VVPRTLRRARWWSGAEDVTRREDDEAWQTRAGGGRRLTAVILTALVALGPVSTDVYLPSLPGIAADLESTAAMAQLTIGLFIAGFALMMLLAGPLADRFGRKPVLTGGLVLFVAASVVCALSPTIEALLAARFVQAVGACVGPVVGRAVVRDLYGPREAGRILGAMASAMAVAPMIGPLLGGWLEVAFGWRANFWFLGLYGAVVLVALRLRLDETLPRRPPGASDPVGLFQSYRLILREPRYLGFTLAVSFSFGALFTWISNASFVIISHFGVAPDRFAFAFGAVIAGYAMGGLVGGRLGMRLGLERATLAGAVLGLLGGTALLIAALTDTGGLLLIVVANALAFLAAGIVIPQGTAGALILFPDRAGSSAALLGFVQMMTGLAVNALSSLAFDGTPQPMAVLNVTCAALSFVACVGVVRQRRGTLARPSRRG
jgi:DHA1 family bicyclomycin/chloramphenicol resistance-like MFS transporter